MPKKHKAAYIKNSSYVHPSLGTAKSSAADPPPGPATVNEKLQQLRHNNQLTQQQRDIAQGTTQRSVPPELRALLGVPETAPPRPRLSVRTRIPLRTPGPAPPPSWSISGNTHHSEASPDKPRSSQASSNAIERARPKRLAAFLCEAGYSTPTSRSLTHVALRTLARAWEGIDDDGLQYLAENSANLRSAVLSYLGFFGPTNGMTARQLEALLDAPDGMSCLDLTGLVGWTFGLRELVGVLARYSKRSAASQSRATSPQESWDADDDDATPTISRLTHSSIPAITALSLALPPSTISWTDLINLSTHLPTLTHLSLASWPWPTKTPHLSSTTISSPSGRIAASGSTPYAALDADLTEARLLLRQLSRRTYCLHHLDVSGCSWTAALAPPPTPAAAPRSPTALRLAANNSFGTATTTVAQGPDWTGAWKRLTTLRLADHSPAELRWCPAAPRWSALGIAGSAQTVSAVHAAALAWLKKERPCSMIGDWRAEYRTDEGEGWGCWSCSAVVGTGSDCRVCESVERGLEGEFRAWMEREVGVWETAARIREVRKREGMGGGLRIEVGWGDGR